MVRRSDHCLPSDSDKFTIKLHSLPSKFPSSLPFVVPRLSLSLSPRSFLSQYTLPRTPSASREASSRLRTRESSFGGAVVYSPAITITLSVHPRHRVPLNSFRPLRVVPLISPFSSRLVVPSISLLLFLFSPSLRFFVRVIPSPLVFSPPPLLFPDNPVASTTAIPQLFSTFLALVAVAAGPRVPSITAYFTGISLLFSLSFVPLFDVRPFYLSAVRHPVGIHFSFRRIFSRTSRLLFHSRNG